MTRRGELFRLLVALAITAGCSLEHPVTLLLPGADAGESDTTVDDLGAPDAVFDAALPDITDVPPTDIGPYDTADDTVDDTRSPVEAAVDAALDGGPDDAAGDSGPDDAVTDAVADVPVPDTGTVDAGMVDTGTADTGTLDAGRVDAGRDVATVEAGTDAADASVPDAGGWHTVPTVTSVTGWHGGDHSGPETVACSDGELMVGTVLQSSQYVNAIGLRCARLNPDGSLGVTRRIDPRGGDRGTPDDETCPAGNAIARMEGRAGAVCDQLTPMCAPVMGWYSAGTTGIRLPTHGENGGDPWGESCPARQMAYGVQITTTYFDGFTRVQSLRVLCVGVSP